jgi:hypothetical protein
MKTHDPPNDRGVGKHTEGDGGQSCCQDAARYPPILDRGESEAGYINQPDQQDHRDAQNSKKLQHDAYRLMARTVLIRLVRFDGSSKEQESRASKGKTLIKTANPEQYVG